MAKPELCTWAEASICWWRVDLWPDLREEKRIFFSFLAHHLGQFYKNLAFCLSFSSSTFSTMSRLHWQTVWVTSWSSSPWLNLAGKDDELSWGGPQHSRSHPGLVKASQGWPLATTDDFQTSLACLLDPGPKHVIYLPRAGRRWLASAVTLAKCSCLKVEKNFWEKIFLPISDWPRAIRS